MNKKEINYWRKTVEGYGLDATQSISGRTIMKFIETIEQFQNEPLDILVQIQNTIEQKNDDKWRIEKCDEILDYVNYYKRLAELSDKEKLDFIHCNEGFPLTDEQREVLNKSDDLKKDYYFDMWARSTYFKLCAWLNYLGGHTKEKPPV